MPSSVSVMLKDASPSRSMTRASGRAALAPMAAGKPYPIVPSPPEVILSLIQPSYGRSGWINHTLFLGIAIGNAERPT